MGGTASGLIKGIEMSYGSVGSRNTGGDLCYISFPFKNWRPWGAQPTGLECCWGGLGIGAL